MMGVTEVEIRHFHWCCGVGGGARGSTAGARRPVRSAPNSDASAASMSIQTLYAILRDWLACEGTVLDLFDREQFREFHGIEAPADWQEATPEEIRRAPRNERPHTVFTSCPCKGYSGLLPEEKSRSAKYQALNRLALRACG